MQAYCKLSIRDAIQPSVESEENALAQPIRVKHLVGGKWQARGATAEDRNPAHPGEVVALVPRGSQTSASAALQSARHALRDWARVPALARGELLDRTASLLLSRAEAIALELSREEGKTLTESTGEVRRAASIFRYFAGRTADPIGEVFGSGSASTSIATIRQPIGVVAIVTPWNFPIAIPAWKIAPALAYGNTVVFKPAGATPLTAYRLVECLVDAGLPAGVLNLLHAPGSAVTAAWLRPNGVDALSFTGSTDTGASLQGIAAAAHLKVQLELGGKNAVVVAADADLDQAADAIVRSAFNSAGQKCTAASRVIVVQTVMRALRDRLADRVRALPAGDPLDPATVLPPLIDSSAQSRVGQAVGAAESQGARVVARSRVPDEGYFHPAVLLDTIDPTMAIANEEIFGPVVGLLEARQLGEAIELHNSVRYGLSGSIFTSDLRSAHAFAQSAQAGVIHINGDTTGAEPHVPFGGMKGSSSWSREQGLEAERFYTQVKTIYHDGLPVVGLFDHPPYPEV